MLSFVGCTQAGIAYRLTCTWKCALLRLLLRVVPIRARRQGTPVFSAAGGAEETSPLATALLCARLQRCVKAFVYFFRVKESTQL